jgi:signal transduction histidine kinase
VRWLHGRAEAVLAPGTGAVAGLRGVCQDITKSKEIEDARQACYELLSRVSREVRGPLNATLGLAERLERTDFGNEQVESVTAILRATQHLVEFVDRFLEGGGPVAEGQSPSRRTDPSP